MSPGLISQKQSPITTRGMSLNISCDSSSSRQHASSAVTQPPTPCLSLSSKFRYILPSVKAHADSRNGISETGAGQQRSFGLCETCIGLSISELTLTVSITHYLCGERQNIRGFFRHEKESEPRTPAVSCCLGTGFSLDWRVQLQCLIRCSPCMMSGQKCP